MKVHVPCAGVSKNDLQFHVSYRTRVSVEEMGVDIQGLRLLLRSRNTASYENFLMLGRQWCNVSADHLKKELAQTHSPVADIESAIVRATESRFIEPVLEVLGAHKIESMDFSDYEGATIVHDLNEPVPDTLKGKFSCIFDGGTTEHIFNFPQAIKNAMEMVAVGGHFLGVVPANNFSGHGFYQFSPDVYWRIFSEPNGYEVEEMSVCETHHGASCYAIDDPEKVGRRVEFTNSRPAYLIVRARRLWQSEIFKSVPQQTYYTVRWSPQTDAGNLLPRRTSLREWAKRTLPESVKKSLRPLVPLKRQLRFSGLKKI
jgi:hypothetical protein